MDLLILAAGWVASMYALAVWVRSVLRAEQRKAKQVQENEIFGQVLDMKYLADVSDEQKEEWRVSRWD